MVILLDGLSQLSRAAIAEKAVEQKPSWQHLALEVIEQSVENPEQWDFHLQLIKRCAEELSETGMHLILTLPGDSDHLPAIARILKPRCTTVHLGLESDGAYDAYISPRATVNDAVQSLHLLMKE